MEINIPLKNNKSQKERHLQSNCETIDSIFNPNSIQSVARV